MALVPGEDFLTPSEGSPAVRNSESETATSPRGSSPLAASRSIDPAGTLSPSGVITAGGWCARELRRVASRRGRDASNQHVSVRSPRVSAHHDRVRAPSPCERAHRGRAGESRVVVGRDRARRDVRDTASTPGIFRANPRRARRALCVVRTRGKSQCRGSGHGARRRSWVCLWVR